MTRPEEEGDDDVDDAWGDAAWEDEDDAMRWCDDEELDAVDDVDVADARAAETLFGNHAPSAPTSPSERRNDGMNDTNGKTSMSGSGRGGSSASVGHGGAAPKALSFGSVFTHAKAGMEDVDKERVRRIVYDATVGTPHFENELRKEARTTKRIEIMKRKAKGISEAEWEIWRRRSDELAKKMEKERLMHRKWLVCDMDGFYAACEELANPELKKVPVAVAAGPSCVLTTANYVARKYGVRAAMPGFIAKKLCPELVFVKPDFKKYIKASRESRSVFAQYNPDFIAGSLDEAYIEVTKYCAENDVTMEQVAEEIRSKVKEATGGLTCSVGGGCSRRLAKVCSDFNKPNGQYILDTNRDAVLKFLNVLPVRKMYGIGKTLERILTEFGIQTCGDLLEKRAMMLALFTPKAFDFLLGVALGIGTELHPRETPEGSVGRKGVSKSETFKATSDKAYLDAKMTEMATGVAEECQRLNLKGRMVAIKLKRSTFDVIQRQTTLAGPTNDVNTIVNSALRLMRNENSIGASMSLRLVGARVSQFDHEEEVPEDQAKIENFLLSPETAAATQNVDKEGEMWLCKECTRKFPLEKKDEHLDWHVARRLQAMDDAAQARSRLAATNKGTGKKQKGMQSDLKMFFRK